MMPGRSPFAVLVLVLMLAASAAPARGAPELFALSPSSGPAGTHIQVRGRELGQTRRVLFAVGTTFRSAAFKVLSDDRLEVIAPEYYRPGAAATVAVFTAKGVTVALPAAAHTVKSPIDGDAAGEPGASAYRILHGGQVANAESVAVIEWGGVVDRSTRPAMHFVKGGGTLLRYDNPRGIIFREAGANFGPKVVNRREPLEVVWVPAIGVSLGVGPFTYTSYPRPAPGDASRTPPLVRSIAPHTVAPGEIVNVYGRGLARTTDVVFITPARAARKAGFRIVGDNRLRVEAPDLGATKGPHLLVIATSEGATITLPRADGLRMELALNPLRPPPDPASLPYVLVGRGARVESTRPQVHYIAAGGIVTGRRAGGVYFVKKGGELADPGGDPAALFYEPEAVLSDRIKGAGALTREVPAITPSVIEAPLEIVTGSGAD